MSLGDLGRAGAAGAAATLSVDGLTGRGLDATSRALGAVGRVTGLDRAAQAAGDVLRGIFCGKLPWQFSSGRDLASCVSGGAADAAAMVPLDVLGVFL